MPSSTPEQAAACPSRWEEACRDGRWTSWCATTAPGEDPGTGTWTGLGSFDWAGVSRLFGLPGRLWSGRQQLHVAAPPDGPVARVLEIVDFGRAAPVHADGDEAVRAAGDAGG